MKAIAELPQITITPRTIHEFDFYREMLSKMSAKFIISKTDESLLARFEEGLIEAKMMKEGKLPKKPLRDLYESA